MFLNMYMWLPAATATYGSLHTQAGGGGGQLLPARNVGATQASAGADVSCCPTWAGCCPGRSLSLHRGGPPAHAPMLCGCPARPAGPRHVRARCSDRNPCAAALAPPSPAQACLQLHVHVRQHQAPVSIARQVAGVDAAAERAHAGAGVVPCIEPRGPGACLVARGRQARPRDRGHDCVCDVQNLVQGPAQRSVWGGEL